MDCPILEWHIEEMKRGEVWTSGNWKVPLGGFARKQKYKSKNGINTRRWATATFKNHHIEPYREDLLPQKLKMVKFGTMNMQMSEGH